MKRILSTGLALILCAAVYAESTKTKNTGAGMTIATTPTQNLAFFGGTPTNQIAIGLTLTNGATVAECVTKLQNIHNALIALGLCKTNAP